MCMHKIIRWEDTHTENKFYAIPVTSPCRSHQRNIFEFWHPLPPNGSANQRVRAKLSRSVCVSFGIYQNKWAKVDDGRAEERSEMTYWLKYVKYSFNSIVLQLLRCEEVSMFVQKYTRSNRQKGSPIDKIVQCNLIYLRRNFYFSNVWMCDKLKRRVCQHHPIEKYEFSISHTLSGTSETWTLFVTSSSTGVICLSFCFSFSAYYTVRCDGSRSTTGTSIENMEMCGSSTCTVSQTNSHLEWVWNSFTRTKRNH